MIFKTTHLFLVRHTPHGGQNQRWCAFAAIPLMQRLSARDAKTKLLRGGISCALFFPNPWGCNDECIYIRTGEKTTPKKVHGCLIRHMMIKGNRISRATV